MGLREWEVCFIRIMVQKFGTDLYTAQQECDAYMESNEDDLSKPSEAVDECVSAWCDSM